MSPRLRADQIPVMNVSRVKAETVHEGEERLTCDLCDWTTVRRTEYAWSAREAHRMSHERGLR